MTMVENMPPEAPLAFRVATLEDVPAIVRLLADDPLGAARERVADPLPQKYRDAFAAMARQPGNAVILAVLEGEIVGCLQLTLIAGLSRRGMLRAQIEGVRVARGHRGLRIGERLVRFAIDRARAEGAGLVQLTTDRSRPDAHRFYERLGFVSSHVGMKLSLD